MDENYSDNEIIDDEQSLISSVSSDFNKEDLKNFKIKINKKDIKEEIDDENKINSKQKNANKKKKKGVLKAPAKRKYNIFNKGKTIKKGRDIEKYIVKTGDTKFSTKNNSGLIEGHSSEEDEDAYGLGSQCSSIEEDEENEVDENIGENEIKTEVPTATSNWNQIIDINSYKGYLDIPNLKYPKPQDDLTGKTPMELFKLFFTDEILDQIVKSTNNNVKSLCYKGKTPSIMKNGDVNGKVKSLTDPITINEFMVYVGVKLLNTQVSTVCYVDYWNRDELFGRYFRFFIPKLRFLKINANLSIENSSTSSKADPLHKVRHFIEYMMDKWRTYFYPGKDITIDESIIPYAGKVDFKVDLRNKPHRRGLLCFGIADSKTGYKLNCEIFDNSGRDKHSTRNRTLRLMKPYLYKGHILYGDNYYTSTDLVDNLHKLLTGYVGTYKNHRAVKDYERDMVKGDVKYYTLKDKPHIMLCIWFDSIIVKTLSNCVNISNVIYMKIGNELKESPLVFKEYNKKARGIDLSNHYVGLLRDNHRGRGYWFHVFFHFLYVTITNAYIIYKNNIYREHGQDPTKYHLQHKVNRKKFILDIARELLYKYSKPCSEGNISKYFITDSKCKRTRYYKEEESIIKHVPNFLFINKYGKIKTSKCKIRLCSRCRKEGCRYFCKECTTESRYFFLCIRCFEDHHMELFSRMSKT